jgi:uncharacterized membrane protein
VLYKIR